MQQQLRALRRASQQISAATARRDQLIRDARAAGATWEQVATAAGMSRAGAIKAAGRGKLREHPT